MKELWWLGEMESQLLKTSYVCNGQLLFGVKLGQLLLVQKEVKIMSGLIPKLFPSLFCTMQIIQKMYFPPDWKSTAICLVKP